MSNHCDVDYKPPAYTIDTFPDRIPSGSRDPTYPRSNSIVFCEKFFKQRYVNDITATPGRQLLDIDTLVSYEHMIIHEWFHNRDTDVASLHIEDIKGDYGDGERTIYGSYATQHYAWRHVLKGGGIGDLEYKSMMNADSYAWMITYNWYKSIYNWNDDGSMQPLKKRDEDPEETTNPYEDMPTTDFVDGDSLPEIENISMPELSTYNPPDCPNCLVTDGGCIANVECRYANDTGVVDDVCTHCTCDVSKTDNSNSTEDLSLTDPKCFGYTGTLPVGYHWSATTAGVPGPTATGGAKFLMPRAEVMDEIWADTQALYD
ncbi:hypothetical protein K491DRAFT_42685 [Lophiostoma macrostomum CBS 122681]|uniref:Uncharacterized protein n=1 Tax=Lophiostoma macrostomum CBS 122681 TaxID=1314788 RepID=A0A6A6SY56_9PLEO|nr:hypothetical protein K491DRAFT_42685 [Lophiostoma macrostomum CBS 122681]